MLTFNSDLAYNMGFKCGQKRGELGCLLSNAADEVHGHIRKGYENGLRDHPKRGKNLLNKFSLKG